MTDTALRLVIHGRVQGVGFRAWTAHHATGLGLRGWVRNRADGTVELLAIGPPQAVEDLAARCVRGPRLAQVDTVDRQAATDDGSAGFDQLPTA
jgi:acylphosphatase